MAAPLADPADLEAWLAGSASLPSGSFTTLEYTRAATVLQHASNLIRGAGTIDEDDIPDSLRDLAVRVSARVWENPTFVRARTVGPFAVSWGPDIGLFLTADERAGIPSSTAGQTAFTINTTPAPTMEAFELYGAQVNGPDGWAPGETCL